MEKYLITLRRLKIVFPAVLTVVLFVITIFMLILPLMESQMMERKRETLRELTESAWSALVAFHAKERSGHLSRDTAQRMAIDHLSQLRYGPDAKDYFFINDMHPRLLMHPYRPDLLGRDVSEYADTTGKRLFFEFARMVKAQGEGYVDYQWQWKDDPDRIVPKISFVKGFDPWKWVIGTGIYVEDVRAEIAAITRKLTWICLAILAAIFGLSAYIVYQGIRTDRKRRDAELALRTSEKWYRLLAETARDIIVTVDLEGHITYFNTAWLDISGFKPEEMAGRDLERILPAAGEAIFFERLIGRSEEQTEFSLHACELVKKDGSRIPVEITSALMLEGGEPTQVLITARDVTGKRKAERQARLQREQLFQASKMASLGTLVSGVAHEINNPVMAVMLNAPILQKVWAASTPILDGHCHDNGDFRVGGMGYGQLRDRVPLLLASIEDSARRIKAIVGDLKDFARQEPSVMKDDVDLNTCAEKAVGLVNNLIKKTTSRFSTDYAADLPRFQGNAQRIEQVVINLLVNACQAIGDTRKPLELTSGFRPQANAVYLTVKDRGPGMDSQVIKRIKDPFFTTKREVGGTGLGLAISDRIIRDHDGSLTFDSREGEGTTASISIPVSDTHQGK